MVEVVTKYLLISQGMLVLNEFALPHVKFYLSRCKSYTVLQCSVSLIGKTTALCPVAIDNGLIQVQVLYRVPNF